MSDPSQPMMQSGSPAIAEQVEEVQGQFPSQVAMQEAVSKLTLAGYDRAELSLPTVGARGADATSNEGADSVTTDTDIRQLRTMGTGMAGYLGAAAAAGITVATGGAAGLALAAAAVVGAGAAATASVGANAADTSNSDELDRLAAEGKLILAVRTTGGPQAEHAMEIMKAAGATKTAAVTRRDQAQTVGVNAVGWTGG